ncbi:MAG: catalase, partial [Propionibacteriaceae bacterium]|nr:catalase [Propionibacteriaceae bacterium]
LAHAVKEAPDRAFPQAQSAHDNFWDFISWMPEAIHMTLWQMSDRAIPRSFRFMEGFGVHTFRFINADGDASFVKFHWKPVQGLQSVVWNEAVKINGADPDFHRRDLWDAINSGDHPSWDLGVQVFDEAFAESFEFDVLDPTKLIPEEQVPVRIVGRLTLDRTVSNDFATTEQAAFQTGNVPPGIDFSEDPLLQGRNFSYLDTQLSRLGSTNFTQLPVNAPRCPVAHFQRDGHMQHEVPTGRAFYEPNGWSGDDRGPRADAETGMRTHPHPVEGAKVRERSETFADHYSQARQFYVSQTPVEQQHIIDAYAFELGKCEEAPVRERVLAHLRNVHADLAQGVADGLGMPLPEPAPAAVEPRTDLPPSDALSILKNGPDSFAGRKLGVLVTPGTDATLFDAVKQAFTAAGAVVAVVAPHVGPVKLSDGKEVTPDEAIDGGPSVLFDAVALLPDAAGAAELAGRATAQDFVSDAFAHRKFIGVGPDAGPLLEGAGVAEQADDGLVDLTAENVQSFVDTLAGLRFWERDVAP